MRCITKLSGCLRFEYSLPIFSKRKEYCVFRSSIKRSHVYGSYKIVKVNVVNDILIKKFPSFFRLSVLGDKFLWCHFSLDTIHPIAQILQ